MLCFNFLFWKWIIYAISYLSLSNTHPHSLTHTFIHSLTHTHAYTHTSTQISSQPLNHHYRSHIVFRWKIFHLIIMRTHLFNIYINKQLKVIHKIIESYGIKSNRMESNNRMDYRIGIEIGISDYGKTEQTVNQGDWISFSREDVDQICAREVDFIESIQNQIEDQKRPASGPENYWMWQIQDQNRSVQIQPWSCSMLQVPANRSHSA